MKFLQNFSSTLKGKYIEDFIGFSDESCNFGGFGFLDFDGGHDCF